MGDDKIVGIRQGEHGGPRSVVGVEFMFCDRWACHFRVGGLYVVDFAVTPTGEGQAVYRECLRRMSSHFTEGFGHMIFMRRECGLPDVNTQKISSALLKKFGQNMCFRAALLESDALAVSAATTYLRTLNALAGARLSVIGQHLEQVLPWVLRRCQRDEIDVQGFASFRLRLSCARDSYTEYLNGLQPRAMGGR